MHLDRPRFHLHNEPKHTILFASSQLQGERENQEDYFINFNDECFCLADGVGGMPNGEVAAKLAAETALWGYKLIRQRPFYWEDKRLFIKRIFRSANIAVWQKHREPGFEAGLATTLVVFITGRQRFWLGSVGDSRAYLLRKGTLKKLTRDDVNPTGYLTKAVGIERYGLVPQFFSDKFKIEDTLLLATDGVTRYLSDSDIATILSTSGTTNETMTQANCKLIELAKNHGSTDNMTVCIVKRIPL